MAFPNAPLRMRAISRAEAFDHARGGRVLLQLPFESALTLVPFTPECPFYSGRGQYPYEALRYFLVEDVPRPGGSGGGGGNSKPEPPKPGPSPESNRKLKGRFRTTSLKCGDTVVLELKGENLPGDANAGVALKKKADDQTIASLSVPMPGGSATADWVAKKPGDGWGKPEVVFDAEASGAKARSDNELEFKKYPDKSAETKTINCSSGIFGWTGKYEIELKAGVLKVRTKVKLVNRQGPKPAAGGSLPAAGPPVSAGDKASMKTDIESKLSGKWTMHRKDCGRKPTCDCPSSRACCKLTVRVVVDFVETGEHHVVNLFQGPGRANATNWTRVKTRDNSWAHETGHLLGWYDEYVGGAVGAAPRWTAPNAGAVMETGLAVPFEYYWDFRDWLKSKLSEEWDGVA